jgi:hypothetical protein
MFLLIYGVLVGAADFSWSFLEMPSKTVSVNPTVALFDGDINSNTNNVTWDAKYASQGCGVLFQFNEPIVLSRVEVFTAKPNQLQMPPLKTEFVLWNDAKQNWEEAISISDVTDKATDKNFTSGAIKTKLDVPQKPICALKILMYGAEICLTEIKLYAKSTDGKERLLEPRQPVSFPAESKIENARSFGGGAVAQVGFWNPQNNYVGNPNSLNRLDRVVFHFDLSEYLEAGKVKRAILVLPLQLFGVVKGNMIELQCFKTEHAPVFNMDIISNDVFPVATMLIDGQSPVLQHLDTTKIINEALGRGEGTVTFRVRNVTVEKIGSRQGKPEGVYVDCKKLNLEIVK